MIANLMMSVKSAARQAFFKKKLFCNNRYDDITSVHDDINKTLPCNANYIVDVDVRLKFDTSSIYVREVICKKLSRKVFFLVICLGSSSINWD